MSVRMKDVPILERPRERLINYGAENLSDEELLAIILKTGSKKMSVKELSAFILSSVGGIKNLKNLNYHKLKMIKGIGEAKGCTLMALSEISKRMNKKITSLNGVKLNSADKVFEFYKDKISGVQEHVYCIYLDASKRVIEEKLLFIGTANYSLIHPRDIFKEAYLINATSIICVHNHPSGNVKPSNDDINMTLRIREVGLIMGIRLTDHIIIGDDKYYSFLENGKI